MLLHGGDLIYLLLAVVVIRGATLAGAACAQWIYKLFVRADK